MNDTKREYQRTPSVLSWFVCFVLTVLTLTGRVFAENKDAFQLYIDNDSRMFKPNHNTDRHYTHGTKLVYLMQPEWQWLGDFSTWHFAPDGRDVDTAVGVFLGQNIYTPNYIDRPAMRSEDDMNFAGWLYTGLFAQRATDDVMDHIELNVGVIGPSSHAEDSQKTVHDWLGGAKPIGWEGQIGDEPAVDLVFMRQQRITDGWLAPTESTDVITEYGFTVGSVHRHVQAGITFRYGYNLGRTFVPGRLELPSGVATLRDKPAQSGYLFARCAGRAVEFNRFMTGLDTEPILGQFQVGAVYTYKRLELGYSQTFFTKEFERQSGLDSIGSLSASWTF